MSKENKTTEAQEDETVAYQVDLSINKKLGKGANLRNVFTPEKIQECQEMVQDAQKNFFLTSRPHLEALEKAYKAVKKDPDCYTMKRAIIEENTERLKGVGESLGFVLIATVCHSLINYLDEAKAGQEGLVVIIEKHINVLQVAFKQKISDDGGALGAELLKSIELLVKKFQKAQ